MTDEEILAAIRVRVSEGRPADFNDPQPLPGPAPAALVEDAEHVIGYPLPPLLRRIYTEIANGGVGPFGGIEGLPGGYSSNGSWDMLRSYEADRDDDLLDPDRPPPPVGVLFFCDFGCAMWSLLDCRHPEGQMWWWESGDRNKLNLTLREWLTAWLTGDIDKVRSKRDLMLADESWSWPDDS
jgi:hypothetical protein